MLKFKKRSGIAIPRKYEFEKFYRDIKDHLTRTSQDYNTSTLVTSTFFKENDKYLVIPRFFPIHDYVQCQIEDISQSFSSLTINKIRVKPLFIIKN